jgi:hypothetical protein
MFIIETLDHWDQIVGISMYGCGKMQINKFAVKSVS